MLLIRDEQMRVFRASALDRYIMHLRHELQQDMAGFCTGLDMESFIRQGLGRAATYGVTSQAAVNRFIRLQLLFGPAFDEVPWAASVLTDTTFTNDADKMTAVSLAATEHLPGRAEDGLA